MINLRQLKSFVLVAEEKSFTKAARVLYMTQPAVSAQIKALEDELGINLFERLDRTIILTEAGELFLKEVRKILSIFEKAEESINELKGLKRGKLVIGASTIPGEYIIPKFIGAFKEMYPLVEIILKISDTGEVTRLLHDRMIDIGIIGAQVDRDTLHLVEFIPDELVPVAHPKHRLLKNKNLKIKDLENENFICREAGSGTRMVVLKRLQEKGMSLSDLKIVMELGSTRAVITAVEANLGVSIVSRWAAEEAIKLGRIKELPLEDLKINRRLYIALNKSRFNSPLIDAFLEFITDIENKKKILPEINW